MKKLYLISCIIFLALVTKAQQPDFDWVITTGSGNLDRVAAITGDASGYKYIAGQFQGTVDFDPGPGVVQHTATGVGDVYVCKLDSEGNLIWVKTFGGNTGEDASDIAVDIAGNVYVTGDFFNTVDFDPGPGAYNITATGSIDMFVVKLDSSGNFIWAGSIRGGQGEQARGITVDSVGNVYTTGFFQGTIDLDPGDSTTFLLIAGGVSDGFVCKWDSARNFVWAKQFAGPSNEIPFSIDLGQNGEVYAAGEFFATADFDPGPGVFNLVSNGMRDIFFLKLDNAGNLIWARSIGGTDEDVATTIRVDKTGNGYITGKFQSAVDFDAGTGTFLLNSLGGSDAFLTKYDASGNFIWAYGTGGNLDDEGSSLFVDSSANVYTHGYFQNTVDFDPGSGTFNLTAVTDEYLFITKSDSAGNFKWAVKTGGNLAEGIFVNDMDVFSAGVFFNTVDFDPGVATHIETSAGSGDFFVLKLIQCTLNGQLSSTPDSTGFPNCNGTINVNITGGTQPYTITWSSGSTIDLCSGWYSVTITDSVGCTITDSVFVDFVTEVNEFNNNKIAVYPNPVNDYLKIKVLSEDEYELIVYDLTSRRIFVNQFSGNSIVNLEELSKGIYIYELRNKDTIIKKGKLEKN